MKITKTAAQAAVERQRLDHAYEQGKKCPECGETRSFCEYLHEYVQKGSKTQPYGVSGGIERAHTSGIFRIKVKTVKVFQCHTCGAEWESDPV